MKTFKSKILTKIQLGTLSCALADCNLHAMTTPVRVEWFSSVFCSTVAPVANYISMSAYQKIIFLFLNQNNIGTQRTISMTGYAVVIDNNMAHFWDTKVTFVLGIFGILKSM